MIVSFRFVTLEDALFKPPLAAKEQEDCLSSAAST
jgi:hypothetical protein